MIYDILDIFQAFICHNFDDWLTDTKTFSQYSNFEFEVFISCKA